MSWHCYSADKIDFITPPDLREEKQSVIGTEDGKEMVDMTLRNSKCVAGYKINDPSKIKCRYLKITSISEGSQHIYDVGGFMKPHRDTKVAPDHIQTLLIIKTTEFCGGAFYFIPNEATGEKKYPHTLMHEGDIYQIILFHRICYTV